MRQTYLQSVRQRGAGVLGTIKCDHPSSIEPGFREAADKKVQAMLILSSPKLPSNTMFPEFAEMGGLVAYGTDQCDLFRQSGKIVGRVLAGTKPADLPVERPTHIFFAVNVKTAAAPGMTITRIISLRPDQAFE